MARAEGVEACMPVGQKLGHETQGVVRLQLTYCLHLRLQEQTLDLVSHLLRISRPRGKASSLEDYSLIDRTSYISDMFFSMMIVEMTLLCIKIQ